MFSDRYHPRENNYRCKSLINSKTTSVSKKTEIIFAELINAKNNDVRMKLQTLQILQILKRVQEHGRWCVGAHIQAFTYSSQDHGRLTGFFFSFFSFFLFFSFSFSLFLSFSFSLFFSFSLSLFLLDRHLSARWLPPLKALGSFHWLLSSKVLGFLLWLFLTRVLGVPPLAFSFKSPWLLSPLFSFLSKALSSKLHSPTSQASILIHQTPLSAWRIGHRDLFSIIWGTEISCSSAFSICTPKPSRIKFNKPRWKAFIVPT